MSASDPSSPALVRAHPSGLESPVFGPDGKLTPEAQQRYAELGAYVDSDCEPLEPEGCLAGGFVRVNPKVVAKEKAEKAAAAKKKRGRTYSDGSYRISKRSPEVARTELIVSNALRYAEDLKKKEDFSQKAPTMPPSRRGRRVHFRC
jgi:hypothetical protein